MNLIKLAFHKYAGPLSLSAEQQKLLGYKINQGGTATYESPPLHSSTLKDLNKLPLTASQISRAKKGGVIQESTARAWKKNTLADTELPVRARNFLVGMQKTILGDLKKADRVSKRHELVHYMQRHKDAETFNGNMLKFISGTIKGEVAAYYHQRPPGASKIKRILDVVGGTPLSTFWSLRRRLK